ncbi:carbonic anhydrase [Taibaiella soli]|uniref:Carbonic anhydrase n=2 Tax=Taibaiella soli TaxID=1649169 RepID=A0A2W2A747_9BACT|nr:carbonic anhydrase [Taibaiella soli]
MAIAIATTLLACSNPSNDNTAKTDTVKTAPEAAPPPLRERVLTAEEQKALTPDMVIASLKEGNQRFMTNNITSRDHSAMVRNAAPGQFPKAVILSCLDSRIPVEDVFDKGIGDLFVARVAGNFSNRDILGSMEFGCKVSGAKLILVLGHESCGAVKGAIDNVKLGNITGMLANIQPAVAKSADFSGEKTSKNPAYVEQVAKNNVLHTISEIRTNSPILKEMEDKGEIKIVGAYYNIQTGAVSFL